MLRYVIGDARDLNIDEECIDCNANSLECDAKHKVEVYL
jgi:hypothetical protein